MEDIMLPQLTDSQKINLNIISMNTRINEQETDVKELMKIVKVGNGELPLVEKVRNLETFVNTLKFWLRTVALALVAQTITFGVAALVYFIKLYPLLEKLSKQMP